MSTMTSPELIRVSSLLIQLLEAENPASQDARPIILQQQEFDLAKMTAIRVISPEHRYRKPDTDGENYERDYEQGDKVIDRLLADGYKIVAVAIVNESAPCGTSHKLIVIMVKLRD